MVPLRALVGLLFSRRLGLREVHELWQRFTRPTDFQPTADAFEATRFVSRGEELSDGRAVHVGEGLEVSEEDFHTLPAELQQEFVKQASSPSGR